MTYNTSLLNKRTEKIKQKRLIGHLKRGTGGPTLIFFGGIHGNEPSGVSALDGLFNTLERRKNEFQVNGEIFGLCGNLPALKGGVRFVDRDLNRLWTPPELDRIFEGNVNDLKSEETEAFEIYHLLREILLNSAPPFYFIDFHTTSADTIPFITINDALINRKFAQQFPVPIILGIEEYLEGPLLSFINTKGYVCIGFESGKHSDPVSITNSEAMAWLCLQQAGVFKEAPSDLFTEQNRVLENATKGNTHFYEITFRESITDSDNFMMYPGFENFDWVKKGVLLANLNGEEKEATKNTLIFMPLYQKQGEEGYFYIRRIGNWALRLSARIRKLKAHKWITLLPGIRGTKEGGLGVMVDLRVARFFSKALFHLLGYRSKKIDKNHLVIYNRELMANSDMYKDCPWYK
ncbi:MAG: succinylglutamate desuccinylase/aspartoacylase family protein [Flavobacteriaceae bacterium]|nr:succinylglutamate desuccinylase/aspartoacylase family protein [Flavobacteriaceae bacterium]MDH3796525.1 succinylglutamate desuccinylase/aspartoacylase family protein [Flavobacteriaceae bacterium]